MDDFLQMHVFFFVTTIAVVVIGILIALILYYVVRILRNVDRLSAAAVEESALIRNDIADLRQSVRKEGAAFKHFAAFAKKFVGRMGKKKEADADSL